MINAIASFALAVLTLADPNTTPALPNTNSSAQTDRSSRASPFFTSSELAAWSKLCASAAVGGLVAYLIALSNRRFTRSHSDETRERSRPELSIRIFGQDARKCKRVILLHPGSTRDSVIYMFDVVIVNASEVGCDDAVLSLQASNECIDDFKRSMCSLPGVYSKDLRRSVVDVGKAFKNVSYTIPLISPQTPSSIQDQFHFETTIDRTIEVNTKFLDGVEAKVLIGISITYPFVVSVMSSKIKPVSDAFNVGVAAAETLETFCAQIKSGAFSLESYFSGDNSEVLVVEGVVKDRMSRPGGNIVFVMSASFKSLVISRHQDRKGIEYRIRPGETVEEGKPRKIKFVKAASKVHP